MDVLLVEDDLGIRASVMALLSDAGMCVTAASNASEALDQPDLAPPKVLVTDVNLGTGIDGLELAAAAHRRWPWIRVVLISGSDLAVDSLRPSDRFLAKPFRGADLVQAVLG
jgi:DNA-binding NtrC family response regulator